MPKYYKMVLPTCDALEDLKIGPSNLSKNHRSHGSLLCQVPTGCLLGMDSYYRSLP